jgi:hypothetical protein
MMRRLRVTNNFFSLETQAGEPIISGDTKVFPFSQALTIRFPFFSGGFIWNRPASVLEVSADGREQVLVIQDVTRIAQIVLLSAGVIGSLFIWLLFRTVRNEKE